jgi:uncharacterized phage protein (TIGR01671 family)
MRDIKFRAWDGQQMVSPEYIDRNGKAHWKADSIPTISSIVMQFTGLHDKTGKEIYEGDIIRQMGTDWDRDSDPNDPEYEKEPQKEIMRDIVSLDRFRFWLQNESFGWEGEDRIEPSDCEVIGNIYENPDLLEAANENS